jgi:hypothetical protein
MKFLYVRAVLLLWVGAWLSPSLFGQASTQSHGSFDFNADGVVFQSADSNTRVLMRFRMQNWATYTTRTQFDDDERDLCNPSHPCSLWRFVVRSPAYV